MFKLKNKCYLQYYKDSQNRIDPDLETDDVRESLNADLSPSSVPCLSAATSLSPPC